MFGKKQIFKIEGMTCQHCVMRVKQALESLDGVEKVKVDLKKAEASIKGEVDPAAVEKAVSAAGYQVV